MQQATNISLHYLPLNIRARKLVWAHEAQTESGPVLDWALELDRVLRNWTAVNSDKQYVCMLTNV